MKLSCQVSLILKKTFNKWHSCLPSHAFGYAFFELDSHSTPFPIIPHNLMYFWHMCGKAPGVNKNNRYWGPAHQAHWIMGDNKQIVYVDYCERSEQENWPGLIIIPFPDYYLSLLLLQLPGLQSLYSCHITWTPSVQHFASHLPSSSRSAQCTAAAQRNHYWSGSAVGKATREGQRAALVPSARGDEGVDGISPRVLSGLGEITSDVIGSSIFCNRTQKG